MTHRSLSLPSAECEANLGNLVNFRPAWAKSENLSQTKQNITFLRLIIATQAISLIFSSAEQIQATQ